MSDVKEKAEEQVCFTRGRLWALYIGAGGGVLSVLSHGIDFLHEIGVF